MKKENSENKNKKFWDKYAKLYDFEVLRFSSSAYKEMYRMMSEALSPDMNVLEIATGTGLIAINIAPYVNAVEAIDYAPKMIETAKKKKNIPSNVHFQVEDAMDLSFANNSFDAVIISNALHIMPTPHLVLKNIKRVLKPNGLLIAPNFSHGHLKESTWDLNAKFLRFIGFESYAKWAPEEYIAFLESNGFSVRKHKVMKAAFPLVYAEAING